MTIKKLTLQNFKRFHNTTIDFQPGMTAILGQNGAGKSTIFDAILYGLFAEIGILKDQIRSDIKPVNEEVRIELSFEHNDQEYLVKRSIHGASNLARAALFMGTDKLAEGTTEVNTAIQSLFGMEPKTFRRTFYSPQNEVRELLDSTVGQRKPIFRKLLGLDILDNQIAALNERVKQAALDKDQAKAALLSDDELTKLKDEITQYSANIVNLQKQITDDEKLHAATKAAKDKSEVEYKSILEKETRAKNLEFKIQDLEKGKKEINNGIESLTKEIVALEEQQPLLARLTPLNIELQNLNEELEKIQIALKELNEKKHLETKKQSAKKSVDEKNKEISELNSKITKLGNPDAELKVLLIELQTQEENESLQSNVVQSISNTIAQTQQSIKQTEKEIKELNAKETICSKCKRPLDVGNRDELLLDASKVLSELQKKLLVQKQDESAKSDSLSIIKQSVKTLRDKQVHLTNDKKQLSEHTQKLSKLNKEVADILAEISSLEIQISTLGNPTYDAKHETLLKKKVKELSSEKSQLDTIKGRVESIPSLREKLEKEKSKLTKNSTDREVCQSELTALSYNKQQKIDAEKTLNGLHQQITEISNSITQSKTEKESYEKLISINEDRIKANDEKVKKCQILENNLSITKKLFEVVRSFVDRVSNESLPTISLHAGKLFSEITGGVYTTLELNESFEFKTIRDGKIVELKTLSGGENDLASVCLRIAICKVVGEYTGKSSLGFLALDEVFASQDLQRREQLVAALDRISSEFGQIFVISHNEDVQQSFPQALVVRKSGSTSTVVALV